MLTKENHTKMDQREMFDAFERRDATYDGLFFVCVTTTKIFCRPSCSARRPKPEHVRFALTAGAAVEDGYRPCLRCRPLAPAQDAPTWLPALLDLVDSEPGDRVTDQTLRDEGIDPVAARRYFRKTYGMTFIAYSRARRVGHAFSALKRGAPIDDAVFDHGWESHSGFRDAFAKVAGAAPGAVRSGDFIRLAWIETPIGPMIAGASERAICLFEFNDRRRVEPQLAAITREFGLPAFPGESPLFSRLKTQIEEYFHGSRRDFDLPLEYPGTDFQRRVWDELRRIPYGQTRSYMEMATRIGAPRASRAVGRANGQNRIAVIIPCHRVIAADGGLGGYGGGLWRKLRLLEMEGGVSQPADQPPTR